VKAKGLRRGTTTKEEEKKIVHNTEEEEKGGPFLGKGGRWRFQIQKKKMGGTQREGELVPEILTLKKKGGGMLFGSHSIRAEEKQSQTHANQRGA